jgi:hypothetical protein
MANGGSGKTRAIVKEALKTPSHGQLSTYAANVPLVVEAPKWRFSSVFLIQQ